MDQRELVERAGRGDHDAFAVLARRVHRAAGSRRPPHPPGPGARARRGPGGLHPSLARPSGPARPGPVRRLAPPTDRQRLPRRRPPSPAPADRGRADADRAGQPVGDTTGRLADRDQLERGFRQLGPTSAPSSCSTTTSGCPSRRSPRPSASRSARPSRGSAGPSRLSATRSAPSPSPDPAIVRRGQIA